jgi:putative ABC transport system permease protein
MLRTTLRSLLARKLRLLLSGLAVVLGVAFVSGTFVLTDTLGKVFDDLFAGVSKGTSVVVRGVSAFDEAGSGAPAPPVDAALLDRIRSVDGVADAIGRVGGYAQIIVEGKPVESGGPSLGVDIQPDSPLETLTLRSGEAPGGPGEVAVDRATVERVGIEIGDRVQVAVASGVLDVTVTGTVGLGETDGFAGAALTAFEAETAQQLPRGAGDLPGDRRRREEGSRGRRARRPHRAELPATPRPVTAAQSSAETVRRHQGGLGFFSTALLVFAGISLFVGAFLIFNTFSMLVAQRPGSSRCCGPGRQPAPGDPVGAWSRRWSSGGRQPDRLRPRRRRRHRAARPARSRRGGAARGRPRAGT